MSEQYQRYMVEKHFAEQGAKFIHYCILTDNVLIEDKSGTRQVVKVPDYLASKYNRQIK